MLVAQKCNKAILLKGAKKKKTSTTQLYKGQRPNLAKRSTSPSKPSQYLLGFQRAKTLNQ